MVLVFDSEAARENGTLPPRAGFTEKAGVLGKDTESQETTLREIVNAFLGVGDAPNSTAAALARSVLGMKTPSPNRRTRLRRPDQSQAPRPFARPPTKSRQRLRRMLTGSNAYWAPLNAGRRAAIRGGNSYRF